MNSQKGPCITLLGAVRDAMASFTVFKDLISATLLISVNKLPEMHMRMHEFRMAGQISPSGILRSDKSHSIGAQVGHAGCAFFLGFIIWIN